MLWGLYPLARKAGGNKLYMIASLLGDPGTIKKGFCGKYILPRATYLS